ncbi:hypothetical protein GCM10022389_21780 [Flavobacterium cheonanense]|uniref:YcxB-like protein domain-containing protein n=1 Tax=Flavobacterium cheonanense TaxID=706183 RepID=A0ABP7VVY1_9FLAO
MKIDIEQSITSRKLIFRRTLLQRIDYYIFNILFLLFLLPSLSIYIIFYGNPINYKGVIFLIIVNVPFIWSIIGLKFINELTYLGKVETNQRSQYLNQIKIDCKYEQVFEEGNLVIMSKNDLWLQGKELTIIFHGEKAYGNLTYLGKGNTRNPFFSYFNKIKLLKRKNYC